MNALCEVGNSVPIPFYLSFGGHSAKMSCPQPSGNLAAPNPGGQAPHPHPPAGSHSQSASKLQQEQRCEESKIIPGRWRMMKKVCVICL